jgi:hypothetical protein
MASAKRKKKVRKSKYADQADALMKVNEILMERQQILEYLVAYLFGLDLTKRTSEHAKALEDGIVMCADEKHRLLVRKFVFAAKEIFRTPEEGETLQ